MLSLENKNYILLDGAFGTYFSLEADDSSPCELACLNNPDAVLAVHEAYIAAGADAIKTNTFAANTVSLGVDFSVVENIVKTAFNLAKKAAGDAAEVIADIGPIPSGEKEEYLRIIDCFLDAGADNFIFETMNSLVAFELAYYVKLKAKCFVIASFAVLQDGYTAKGISVCEIFSAAEVSTADAFGFNCAPPSAILKILGEHPACSKLLAASPNSSYPSEVGGRAVFRDNVWYFAERLAEIHSCGVKILGGCCGTTPRHIRNAVKILSGAVITRELPQKQAISKEKQQFANVFAAKLSAGERIIAVELDPPLDTDFSHIRAAVPALKEAGADVITIADNPLARARADSVIVSAKVQREWKIPAIPHISCRDRNTLGLKSALLGGSIEGLQSLLIVTGDPVLSVDRSETKGVFSMNSFELIKYVDSLNRDVFAGREFFIGSALNVNAANFEVELSRAVKKQENGSKFFFTQPIYDDKAIQNLAVAREKLSGKILAGIMPVVSYKNAVFLNNEVVGIEIPEDFIAEIKDKSREEVFEISLKFSLETARKALYYCDGFYLCTPLKRYDLIVRLIAEIKSL